MTLRRTFLLSGAGLAITLLVIAGSTRLASTIPAARDMDARRGSRTSLPLEVPPLPGSPGARGSASRPGEKANGSDSIPCDTANDQDVTCAAVEELATRDPAVALSAALGATDENLRRMLLAAALRGWARVDLVTAGTWAVAQSRLEHHQAFAALFSGAVSQPDDAVRFAREIVHTNVAEAESCGEALISALCAAGEYEHAVRFASDDAGGRAVDRVTAVYRQWSTQSPGPAWLSALALPDRELRFAALEAAVHAWSQTDPHTLVETARQSAAAPERTMALTMALRAWLDQDLDAASAWLLRWEPTGTLAQVDLDLVLEE